MIKIGITGGIGSGKSVVCDLLRAMGYPVFDTDREAKRLMSESPVLRERLIALFGEKTFEGMQLNRPYLASIIFNDPRALEAMNQVVHPMVREAFLEWAEIQGTDKVFLESAILFESDFYKMLDEVWCVSAPESLRIERVVKRDRTTPERVLERMRAQMPQQVKEEKAHRVILNNEEKALIPQVLEALQATHP